MSSEDSPQEVEYENPPPLENVREGAHTTIRAMILENFLRLSCTAMPLVVVSVPQYLIRATSMMMLGHLSSLHHSIAAIAYSLCNVTGLSLITGMASALETLSGQAYGNLGTYTYGITIWMLAACIPISAIWVFYTEEILILIGQDSLISAEAGRFAFWLMPSLFPFAILQSLVRYLMIQSLMLPLFICSIATLAIHLPLSWALIFKLELGSSGAAAAISASYWLNAILLCVYVKRSAKCARTRASSFIHVYNSMGEIIRAAIHSARIICLEWWIFELLGGLLAPDPLLEASVLSICLTILTIHHLVPNSFGSAASTRICDVVGGGRAEMDGVIVYAVALEVVAAGAVVFACSNNYNILGKMLRVVGYANLQLQTGAAVVNLVAHYVVGISVAVRLGLYGRFHCYAMHFVWICQTSLNTQVAETRRRLFHQNTTT